MMNDGVVGASCGCEVQTASGVAEHLRGWREGRCAVCASKKLEVAAVLVLQIIAKPAIYRLGKICDWGHFCCSVH